MHATLTRFVATLDQTLPGIRAAEELRGEVGELLRAVDQRADAAQDPERGAGGAAGLERPRTEADDTAGDQKVGQRKMSLY